MNKKITGILLAGMLALGSMAWESTALAAETAAAPDAAAFAAEEQLGDQWLDRMLIKSKTDEAFAMMSERSKKSMNQDKLQQVRAKIATDMGNVKGLRFVSWTRYDQNDQLVYLMSFDKQPVVRCLLVFDKKGQLDSFVLNPMQVKEQKAGDKKKS